MSTTKRSQNTDESAVLKPKKARKTETALERLKGALQDLPRVDDEIPTSNDIPTRLQILQAKDEMEVLNEINLALESRIYRMSTKVDDLFSSLSPMLSLGENLLSKIMSYLDEEALLAATEASNFLDQRVITVDHWQKLEEKRAVGLLLYRFGTREGGVAFAKAARFASRMEQLAAEHYDYDYPAADIRSIKCEGCDDFPSVFHVRPLDRLRFHRELFVRFSFRNSRSLIWEGFVPETNRNETALNSVWVIYWIVSLGLKLTAFGNRCSRMVTTDT